MRLGLGDNNSGGCGESEVVAKDRMGWGRFLVRMNEAATQNG